MSKYVPRIIIFFAINKAIEAFYAAYIDILDICKAIYTIKASTFLSIISLTNFFFNDLNSAGFS